MYKRQGYAELATMRRPGVRAAVSSLGTFMRGASPHPRPSKLRDRSTSPAPAPLESSTQRALAVLLSGIDSSAFPATGGVVGSRSQSPPRARGGAAAAQRPRVAKAHTYAGRAASQPAAAQRMAASAGGKHFSRRGGRTVGLTAAEAHSVYLDRPQAATAPAAGKAEAAVQRREASSCGVTQFPSAMAGVR